MRVVSMVTLGILASCVRAPVPTWTPKELRNDKCDCVCAPKTPEIEVKLDCDEAKMVGGVCWEHVG